MYKLCIDRIEGSWAICQREDGILVQLPRNQLPPEVQEGDFLQWEANGYVLDPVSRSYVEQHMADRLHQLQHNHRCV